MLEDFLLLLQLLLTDLVEVFDFTLLRALLDLAHDLDFLTSVVSVNFVDVAVQLGINIGLLLLVLSDLFRFIKARNDGIDTTLAIISRLSQLLLFRDLLFHHGQHLFLQFYALLLIELE